MKRNHRKRQAPPPAESGLPPGWLEILDAVTDRLDRVRTVAGLLSACVEPEMLDRRRAAEAGCLVEEEIAEAKALLRRLPAGLASIGEERR